MPSFITREDISRRIKELVKEFEIIGPKELPPKGIFYQPIKEPQELYLGGGFTTEPIKKYFLSPWERLFEEKLEKDINLEAITLPETRRIIIGVRPCEARGLVLLDKVFDGDYKDNFFINNRKRTIMVGLACSRPDRCCFCTSLGGSPIETRGLDALLFNMENKGEERFIVEIITDKGKEIFGSLGEEIKEDQNKSLEIDKEKRQNLVKTRIKVPGDSLDNIFESDYWLKISLPCLSCGICTYLCPTCHCFDLVDEDRQRLRCYDGCAFPDFTLEASGENPRPTKKERYRQRAFHKFDYFKKNFGENLCVGCGRCIRFCPVKMDISEIIDKAPI